MYLLTKRVNRLWKRNQGNKFRSSRRIGGRFESTFGQRKSNGNKVIFYECNEPGHYKNDCPQLQKDIPRKKSLKGKKKGLMETWDDSDSSDCDSDGEHANMVLSAHVGSSSEVFPSKDEAN